jgi:hypothetical protein
MHACMNASALGKLMVLHVRLRLSQKHLSTDLTFTCIYAVCCLCLFCIWFVFDILMLIVSLHWLYSIDCWMQEGARGNWNLGFDESQDSFPPTWHHHRTFSICFPASDRDHESSFFPAPCSAMFGVLLYSQHSKEPTNCCSTASISIEMDHDARRTSTRGECHCYRDANSTCHRNRSHEFSLVIY